MPRRKKGEEKEVALDRVRKLFRMAESAVHETPELSDRYVRLARRIAMRYQVSIPSSLRRRFCRGCDTLLVPGRSARVRMGRGRVSVTCLRCNTIKRYPYERPAKVAA